MLEAEDLPKMDYAGRHSDSFKQERERERGKWRSKKKDVSLISTFLNRIGLVNDQKRLNVLWQYSMKEGHLWGRFPVNAPAAFVDLNIKEQKI